jgi:hypothetical protein
MLTTNLFLILAVVTMSLAFLETVAIVSLVAVALGHPKIVENTFSVVNRFFDAIICLLKRKM